LTLSSATADISTAAAALAPITVSYTQQYINSYVQTDPIIEYTFAIAAVTNGPIFIAANNNNWITALGLTSRASNNIIPSSL